MATFHDDRQAHLTRLLKELGPMLVAFSGGVDSSVLLAVAAQVMPERLLAVTVDAPIFPRAELEQARAVAMSLGVEHEVVPFPVLEKPAFTTNDDQRCYHCKRELLLLLLDIARQRGLATVVEGSNLDDRSDYRPGRRAVAELGVRSPLLEAGFGKRELRALARKLGLAVADKPAQACLASRLAYGEVITVTKLRRVERAEQYVGTMVDGQFRVRSHGDLARLEVEAEFMPAILNHRNEISDALEDFGYNNICLDLRGYRVGSMNEAIEWTNNT